MLADLPAELDHDARVEAVVEALLGAADAEMYAVKRARRGVVQDVI
jgi:hypothetical protein